VTPIDEHVRSIGTGPAAGMRSSFNLERQARSSTEPTQIFAELEALES
jgi:hypothetical protein